MAWTLEYSDRALRKLRKLDRQVASRISDGMEWIAQLDDVRSTGLALVGPLGALWRYRIGDYRVLCDIQDNFLRILVVELGHRSEIYS